MFAVPPPPTAAAQPTYDMTRAGVQSPMVPQGVMMPEGSPGLPHMKKGILAAIVCAGTGLAIGVFVTRAWMKAHAKKKA